MRKITFLIFIFIPLFGLTQGNKFYQLQNKGKPNYTESNHFFTDSIWRFNQTITYDEANVFDEENWTKLEIQIKDTATFLQRKTLDFSDDSLVAKHCFTVLNVWSSNQDSTSIIGQVQLLSITHEGILLKLNLTVTSLRTQNQFIYTGERIFNLFNKMPSIMDLYDRIPSFKYLHDSTK